MWLKSRFFNISIGIILVLAIIYLTIQIEPILNIVFAFATTLLYPIIIALVLYYVTRPFREFMEKKKVPRIVSILLIFILIYLCISFVIIFIWPYVSQQIVAFTETPKEKIKELENKTIDIMNIFNITSIPHEQLRETLMFYFRKAITYFSENIIFTISSIAKIASYFIITPFLLFYFLKDDYKMSADIIKTAPRGYKKICKTVLDDIDSTLSVYISGQVLIALIVGFLIYIGYFIIGLNYAILMALLAFVFNLIPFCGPFISTIPALMIGLSVSPFMGFKVIAVVLIVHLLDLNLISPRIVGQRLNIHPVTVILLLVASFSVFGFIGIFIVTPLYAVLKAVIEDLYLEPNSEEK